MLFVDTRHRGEKLQIALINLSRTPSTIPLRNLPFFSVYYWILHIIFNRLPLGNDDICFLCAPSNLPPTICPYRPRVSFFIPSLLVFWIHYTYRTFTLHDLIWNDLKPAIPEISTKPKYYALCCTNVIWKYLIKLWFSVSLVSNFELFSSKIVSPRNILFGKFTNSENWLKIIINGIQSQPSSFDSCSTLNRYHAAQFDQFCCCNIAVHKT